MGPAMLAASQPWHKGERMLQEKQGTVESSNEMGPRIYHKVIPESYRDMIGPQPHFMVSFLDPTTGVVWPSVVFARPGFADSDTSDGTRIDLAAAIDPRDGAATSGLVKPGTMVGGVQIDWMSRRRNRFNGVISHVGEDGHFQISITQAFGNCPKYITRRRVKRMGENNEFAAASAPITESTSLGEEEVAIVSKADMVYLGTGTAEYGADMNIRGGSPGFIRVIEGGRALCWPDYTGNGFYMSLGNVQLNRRAGIVAVDWDGSGRGVQVLGRASTHELKEVKGEEMMRVLREEPQALRLVRLDIEFVRSIPRYCPHTYESVELSPYSPRPLTAGGPEYLAVLQWAKEESQDVKTFEFQLAPLPLPGAVQLRPGQHVRLALPALQKPGQAVPPERTWTVTSEPSWFAEHGRFQISVKLKEGGLASSFLHGPLLQKGVATSEAGQLHFLGFSGDFAPQLDPQTGDFRARERLPRHVVYLVGGIGVTPAAAGVKASLELEPRPKTITVLYSARTVMDAAFLKFFLAAADAMRKHSLQTSLRLVLFLTGPHAEAERKMIEASQPPEVKASMRVVAGRLSTAAALRAHLPFSDFGSGAARVEGFLCGPPAYEAVAAKLWAEAGLPSSALRTESFAY